MRSNIYSDVISVSRYKSFVAEKNLLSKYALFFLHSFSSSESQGISASPVSFMWFFPDPFPLKNTSDFFSLLCEENESFNVPGTL